MLYHIMLCYVILYFDNYIIGLPGGGRLPREAGVQPQEAAGWGGGGTELY